MAIVGVTGCSSTPTNDGFGLDTIGSGISKAGRKTVELSSRAWEGTKDFLHIRPQETELLDEVDLALMDDDELPAGVIVEAVEEPTFEMTESFQNPDIELAEEPAAAETVLMADLHHEVQSSETLWEIAKKTTGDANNWHVIADINNLAPNAAVFEGQSLLIPADMVKPGYGSDSAPEQAAAAAESVTDIDEIDADSDNKRLKIPTLAEADAEQKPAKLPVENGTPIALESDETLWDFAKRTTGDATNWKIIAETNLFTETQATLVRPGQLINVPTELVRQRDENGVLIAREDDGKLPTRTTNDTTTAVKTASTSSDIQDSKVPEQQAVDASVSVLAGTNQTGTVTEEIKIVEAAYQPETKPTTSQLAANEVDAAGNAASNTAKVMVSGTYYPKAVYNEADFSSSLLMRVSPGTELVVSKAIGPWLEVQTDKGTGYVHSRDIK